jgi:hypothetical protein
VEFKEIVHIRISVSKKQAEILELNFYPIKVLKNLTNISVHTKNPN